jgi:hypothetical protein
MTKQAANQTAIDDLLMGAAKPANAQKGKKGTPEVSGLGELADKTYTAYQALQSAEAEFSALDQQVVDATQAVYEAGARNFNFAKTYNVPGNNTPGVQVVRQDKFKATPIEALPNLKSALGDKFDSFYEVKRTLTLSDTSNETISLLLEKLGEDTFKKIFAIKLSVETKDNMDLRQFELPEDARPAQYKASIKIRK